MFIAIYFSGCNIKDGELIGVFGMHGEKRNAYRRVARKPEGTNNLEDLDVDGKTILKCILN